MLFHYTVQTNKSPTQAISDLTDSLKEEQFGVLWSLDMKEKLNDKGVDFNQLYYILEVCNPVEANRVLSENVLVGYFLPCKIAVYEDQGTTKIGMPKPTALIHYLENEKLSAIAQEIEQRLISCIDHSI